MHAIPNSSALDRAAAGGGPGARVLPWIAGGEPSSVLGYAAELTQRAARLAAIVAGVEDSSQALRQAWSSGSAADGAIHQLTATVQAFHKITAIVRAFTDEIQAVSTALTVVQQGYRATVGATNPTVAALLSNPHTHAAARALATSTTAGLSSFVQTTRTVLDQIGLVRMIALAGALTAIAADLDKLLSGDAPAPLPAPAAAAPAPAGLTGYGSAGWTGYAPRTP